jgi:hypothetical protein
MPKFTVAEFLEKVPALSKLGNPPPNTVDIYTGFKLGDFMEAAQKKSADIEKARRAIVDKYLDKETKGIPEGKMEAYKVESEEFLAGEVVLPNVEPPIPLAKLDKVGFSPLELLAIRFLLKDVPEPEVKEKGGA